MSLTLRQRWRTRKLVGDQAHVLIVRIRPGTMHRDYVTRHRIDNGELIQPPLIWKGNNHADAWKGYWEADGPWRELPNVRSSKFSRSFDIQTGAAKGTSTLTVAMDNIDFPEKTGVGGLYHQIDRGYFSPQRGVRPKFRPHRWADRANTWKDVLNSGWQIETWEGYGTGTDVQLVWDADNNTWAPASGALARTWTGIIVDYDSETEPAIATLTAQDFGIFLTDSRLFGYNKAKEIHSPMTFADRRRTLGEKKLTGPLKFSSGGVNEDGEWTSQRRTAAGDHEWIEVTLPHGYYEHFYIAPKYTGLRAYVSLHMSDDTGKMDGTTALPEGWVDLTGPGTGTVDGIPYMREIGTVSYSPARRYYLGHGFTVPAGTKLRITFTHLKAVHEGDSTIYRAGTDEFAAYKFGTDPRHPVNGQPGVRAKNWVLVEDASDVVKAMLVWAGFPEWKIERFGWSLYHPMIFGEDKYRIDAVQNILQQGSYIFYIGAPTNDDRSIGVPHLEKIAALKRPTRNMLQVKDTDMTEKLEEKWDLSDLPYVIRYRGAAWKHGNKLGVDTTKRYMATYYSPWSTKWPGRLRHMATIGHEGHDSWRSEAAHPRVAGIIRHFAQTMGNTTVASLNSNVECLFACVLAAIQYGLNMATATFQIPGVAGVNLNTQVSVADEATAVNSRIWVASIESEHTLGPNGKWTITFGGSLIDTEDMDILRDDHDYAWRLNQRKKAAK